MAEESIAQKLLSAAKADLANYERLRDLCEREFDTLSGPDMEALTPILREKEKIIRDIEKSSERHAPLWAQVEDAEGSESSLDDLGEAVQKVQGAVEAVQKSEEKIAELVSARSQEIRKALGAISKSGKALSAYKPVRTYAPRFLDRKE